MIHKVERKNGNIRIKVSDNVMVASVEMMILDDEGKVAAEVQDLGGNVVKMEHNIPGLTL